MNAYRCTIFNDNYTFEDRESWLGAEHILARRIASAIVWARTRREAAAKGYVCKVGRHRGRFLIGLNAPKIIIFVETRWRSLAGCLQRTTNWMGDCFFWDNMVEAFYIRVDRLFRVAPDIEQRVLSRKRRYRQMALATPVAN